MLDDGRVATAGACSSSGRYTMPALRTPLALRFGCTKEYPMSAPPTTRTQPITRSGDLWNAPASISSSSSRSSSSVLRTSSARGPLCFEERLCSRGAHLCFEERLGRCVLPWPFSMQSMAVSCPRHAWRPISTAGTEQLLLSCTFPVNLLVEHAPLVLGTKVGHQKVARKRESCCGGTGARHVDGEFSARRP